MKFHFIETTLNFITCTTINYKCDLTEPLIFTCDIRKSLRKDKNFAVCHKSIVY